MFLWLLVTGYVGVVAAVALVGSMTTCVGGVNEEHSKVSLNIIGTGEECSEDKLTKEEGALSLSKAYSTTKGYENWC